MLFGKEYDITYFISNEYLVIILNSLATRTTSLDSVKK